MRQDCVKWKLNQHRNLHLRFKISRMNIKNRFTSYPWILNKLKINQFVKSRKILDSKEKMST